jgi:hypothetical protein
MQYSNPSVIVTFNDATIGSIDCGNVTELNYLSYISLVKKRITQFVFQSIKENVSSNTDFKASLGDILYNIYEYLSFEEKRYPNDFEGVAKELFNSKEYIFWQTEIYSRFMNMHIGVINETTLVPIGGKNPAVNDDTLSNVDIYEIILSLSSNMVLK